MARRAVWVASLAIACAHAPPPAPSAAAPEALAASEPAPPAAEPTPALAPEASTAVPARRPRAARAPPPEVARADAPAAVTPWWTAEGCLTASGEAEARRFARERPRAAGRPAITVEPAPGGAVLVHRLAHACCVRAEVVVRVEGSRHLVTERLSGKPCGCVCASTIRVPLSAPPGRYALAVDVVAAGVARRAFDGEFEVR